MVKELERKENVERSEGESSLGWAGGEQGEMEKDVIGVKI